MNARTGRLNAWLDSLPRPTLFRACRPQPAFLGMGAAGYHAALAVTLGAGLFTGKSALVLAALSAVCAASFFGWALLRRRITGGESYVLFEHLWAAELSCAGACHLLGEPVLPYLDVVSLGLATFLFAGRIGCFLAGCCHGLPSSVGAAYGEEHAKDGFPRHLTGVRLFPVQLVESAGLAAIGLTGLVLLPSSPPGRVFAWVLVAYAVMRFGTEGIRGDERPRLWGLSQSRWMAIAEAAAAIAILERASPMTPARWAAAGIVLAALLALVVARAREAASGARLCSPDHAAEVRALVRSATESAGAAGILVPPDVLRTRLGASIGVSPLVSGGEVHAHVSLMLPLQTPDLEITCALLARALPEAAPTSARAAPLSLLHVVVPCPLPATAAPRNGLADALFGAATRLLQGGHAPHETASLGREDSGPSTPEEHASPAESEVDPPRDAGPPGPGERPSEPSLEEKSEPDGAAAPGRAPAWSAPAFSDRTTEATSGRWVRRTAPREP